MAVHSLVVAADLRLGGLDKGTLFLSSTCVLLPEELLYEFASVLAKARRVQHAVSKRFFCMWMWTSTWFANLQP